MEKYSIEWKRARGAWVQDHITTDTTGSPCRVWKLHYIQHDTEYSRGEYRTKKEATTELSAYKAARALGSMTSPAKQASSRANGKRGGRPRTRKMYHVVRLDLGIKNGDGAYHQTHHFSQHLTLTAAVKKLLAAMKSYNCVGIVDDAGFQVDGAQIESIIYDLNEK